MLATVQDGKSLSNWPATVIYVGLKEYVSGLRSRYDYILLDCAPSLGLITINALACADSVLIPVQAAKLALDGLQGLIRTIRKIRRQINPDLTIEGVLITMVNPRTRYARETMEMLRNCCTKRNRHL